MSSKVQLQCAILTTCLLTGVESDLFNDKLNDSTEIPDFLSGEECDHIVDLSESVGMFKSFLHMDPISKEHRQRLRGAEGRMGYIQGNIILLLI